MTYFLSIRGRVSRGEFIIFSILIGVLTYILTRSVNVLEVYGTNVFSIKSWHFMVLWFLQFMLSISWMTFVVRRLHDCNLSLMWLLFNLFLTTKNKAREVVCAFITKWWVIILPGYKQSELQTLGIIFTLGYSFLFFAILFICDGNAGANKYGGGSLENN